MIETRIITTEQAEQLKLLLNALGINLEQFLLINNMKELIDKTNSLESEIKELKNNQKIDKEHILYLEDKLSKDATEKVFGVFTYNDNEDMSNV